MGLARTLQLVGFLIVSYVLFTSLSTEMSMLFEFGGLALGAAVFLLGKWVERPAEG